MRNGTIQRRVLVIALLPAALIALALTAYHVHTRLTEAERMVLDRGHGLARHLAPLSEFGVISGNRELLQSLARSARAEDETIARVTIRDARGRILARAGSGPPDRDAGDAGALIRVGQPVQRTVVPGVDDLGRAAARDPAVARAETIGRVEILVDLRPVRREETAVLLESLGITALALLVTGALALRIGRGVTGPVRALTRTVERIRAGDLAARPPLRSGGELGSLEGGIAEMAAEIEQTQTSMRDRVDRATAELQATLDELEARNAELEEARREAEAASEFKSRFLANISHEIRTPMNSILGFAELLGHADLDPVEADYVETIRDSARSLLGLLNGILDLSKVESGRMELEYTDTDLNEVLLEVFQLLGPHALQKGVEFLVHPVPAAMAPVRTDRLRLKQVLINLASNAVKFTDAGHVRIGAQAASRADGTVGITFSVEDTGRGIPESAQTRLFQAFAQGRTAGDASRYATDSGTGLGLHIASEIVFLMEGLIEFRSEPGKGSVFWFSLELEPAAAAAGPAPARPGRTLVVVDPEAATAAAHAAQLEAAGYPVRTFPAAERIALAGDEAAIIVRVPARALLEGPVPALPEALRESALPVFAHAHAHGPETRQRLLEAGFDHVLPETPDPDALRRAIEPVVSGEPPAAGADSASRESPESGARRVLVVDDHPVNRKLFESYLADTGIEAVTATESDEMLYRARTERFDAILLDVHLPGRDGIEAARRLRAGDSPNARTPVIAITADAFEEQSERAMQAGVNDLLVKPVSRERLLRSLAAWCPARAESAGSAARADGDGTAAIPAYDHEEAVRRAGGRPDVAGELFRVLLRSLPESRASIDAAAAATDREGIRSAAHRLRGAAAYCGVPRLEAAVSAVEHRAREGDEASLRSALAELDAAIAELLAHEGTPGSDGA